jgi:hypothetical protein
LNDAVVQQALDEAWRDSRTDDPVQRHEEGGWIYMDLGTADLSIQWAPAGTSAGIDLHNPPILDGRLVVAKFHTHPNPTSEGWNPGASRSDQAIDAKHGVPDIIRADDGVHVSGPTIRRGGLSGGPGYPP